jgi:hypothetical protein
MPAMPTIPEPGQLLIGSLAADGLFGATTVIPSGPPQNLGPAAAVPSGEGFVAVWGESGNLRFARFDAAGASASAPKDVITGADEVGGLQIAAGPDGGFGVVYTTTPNANNRQLNFVVVSPAGAVRGGPRRFDQTPPDMGSGRLPAAAIAGNSTGYAMIWRNMGDSKGGIEFAKAGPDGAETVARRRISAADGSMTGGILGFEAPVTGLIEISDGYLAAWVQAQSSSSTVLLARLDPSGVRLGPPAPLRAAAGSIDEVEPMLVPYGDVVAVLWARGNHIFVCGGCIPDHRIDLILVDPTDLTPVSNVVSLNNDAPGGILNGMPGGLLRRQVVKLGPSLLTTFDITFHVHHISASAAFSCQ